MTWHRTEVKPSVTHHLLEKSHCVISGFNEDTRTTDIFQNVMCPHIKCRARCRQCVRLYQQRPSRSTKRFKASLQRSRIFSAKVATTQHKNHELLWTDFVTTSVQLTCAAA